MKIFWGYSHDYMKNMGGLFVGQWFDLLPTKSGRWSEKAKLDCAHIPEAEKNHFSFEHGMNYYYGTKYLRIFYPFVKKGTSETGKLT